MRLSLLASFLCALAACSDPGAPDPDCLVRFTSVTVSADVSTVTASGTVVTARAFLAFTGADNGRVPGTVAGEQVTFDISTLLPGVYNYSFDATCFDERDHATIEAPTGMFTRP